MTKIDSKREVKIVETSSDAVEYAAEHFLTTAQKAISERGIFHVALSGGSTPKALFSLLAKPEFSEKLDWSRVALWWSDERCVEPTNSESNYKMAMDSGFNHLPILDSNIHRMHGELDPEKAAELYRQEIRERLPEQRFDLCMLGMGPDGHTASLFPGTEALDEKERLAVANYVPEKESWRLTLTFECINNSRKIVFYALGDGKKEMVKEVLEEHPKKYPAGHVGTEETPALWILDEAAGSLLSE